MQKVISYAVNNFRSTLANSQSVQSTIKSVKTNEKRNNIHSGEYMWSYRFHLIFCLKTLRLKFGREF